MKSGLLRGVAAAALLGTMSVATVAADLGKKVLPVAPIVEPFNPWMVRVRALGVLPGGSDDVRAAGARVVGGKVEINDTIVPELDITYFFTPNLAAELVLGTTPHRAKGDGTLSGVGRLGKVWLLPPTLTAQYHFTGLGAFKPYVGAGINYTLFYNEKDGALTNFNVSNRFGFALQAGVDIMLDKHWGLNVDVKKLFLKPTATGLLAGVTPVKAKIDLDPWLVGVGVTYKF